MHRALSTSCAGYSLSCRLGKAKTECQTDTATADLAGVLFDGNPADPLGVLGKVRTCKLGRL